MTAAMILLLFAAPAPPARPAPAVVAGAYTMTWAGVDCPAHFHADGLFTCLWAGRWWHGRWTCKGGVLSVSEWVMDDPAVRCEWEVRLSGPMAGTLGREGGSPWALRPAAGRVD